MNEQPDEFEGFEQTIAQIERSPEYRAIIEEEKALALREMHKRVAKSSADWNHK